MQAGTGTLSLTGERTVPGVAVENYWFRRHEVAYSWVLGTFAADLDGAVAVDAGSGEGYGAAMLAGAGPRAVVALEYDAAAAAHSARAYPQVSTVRANLDAWPVADDGADVVLSMQVIEHLWDLRGFWRECRRVLRPSGLLVAATPNRTTFSPGLARGHKPTNPFHVEEFDADQLGSMLAAAGFADVCVAGVRHGQRLADWEDRHGGLVAAQVGAVLSGTWPADLLAAVAAITVSDFVVEPRAGADALDLMVIGRAP